MKNTKRSIAIVVGYVILSSLMWASAQDWPQWRGSNRDSKVSGFTAPKTWPKELTQKWKVTVGQGDATPALVGDKLYVFARQEGKEVIHCLDVSAGKELWRDDYEALAPPDRPAGGIHAGPRSSPTVASGKVVTLGVRGMLSCLDTTTGKKLWRKEEFPGTPRFFTGSSPIIVDGFCIAQLGGQDNGAIVAYDLATGDQKWKWTSDAPAYASPVLLTIGGTKLVVAQTETKIVAVGTADGKLAWETSFAPRGMGYNAATPIVDGQTIIYCGSGRGAKAVKIEKQGEAFAAKELWSNPDNSVQFNSPVLKNGFLFGLTQGNEFFCINAQNGQSAWTAPAGQAGAGGGGRGRGGGGGGYGSIIDAGSVLLALTPSSQLIAYEPSDKQYTELARIKVADTPTYAHPVVAGNRIFIKDQDSVTLWTID